MQPLPTLTFPPNSGVDTWRKVERFVLSESDKPDAPSMLIYNQHQPVSDLRLFPMPMRQGINASRSMGRPHVQRERHQGRPTPKRAGRVGETNDDHCRPARNSLPDCTEARLFSVRHSLLPWRLPHWTAFVNRQYKHSLAGSYRATRNTGGCCASTQLSTTQH